MGRNENIVITSVAIFIIEDLLACKASSVKTHEAEDAVIQKIVQFSSNMKKLSKHLQILVLVLLIR